MEYLIMILIPIVVTAGIIYLINDAYDKELNGVKYKCHKCHKKFYRKELMIKGSWHTKDWICPNCNHHNVTIESYDY